MGLALRAVIEEAQSSDRDDGLGRHDRLGTEHRLHFDRRFVAAGACRELADDFRRKSNPSKTRP